MGPDQLQREARNEAAAPIPDQGDNVQQSADQRNEQTPLNQERE